MAPSSRATGPAKIKSWPSRPSSVWPNNSGRPSPSAIGAPPERWPGAGSRSKRALQGQMEALAEQVQALYRADTAQSKRRLRNRLYRLQRYQSLLAQVQAELSRYGDDAGRQIQSEARWAAGQGLRDALALMEATVKPFGGSIQNLVFDRLGVEAVENITAIARAGKPLATLLQAAYPLAVEGLTERLIYGTAVGWNPRKTARAMLRQGGLDAGLNHLMLVARDQQNRAYREASRQQYDRSGVVTGYRRIAAKQRRTCLACLALDGTVYQTNELMEVHPQDRCTMVPLVRGFAPPTAKTGEQWFRRQSPAAQIEMMGYAKYEAWKAGEFEFRQLATVRKNRTWGPSVRVTPLKDLLPGND